jgi:hypothetical protein
MSTLTSYASQSARDSAAPAANNTGLCIFRSDTKAIEVSDGSTYLTYLNDGLSVDVGTNTLSFDGSTDVATIADDSVLQVNGDMSICAWFQLDVTSGYRGLVGKRDGGGANYVMYTNGNKLVSYDGSSLRTDTTSLSTGTWYHGVIVFNSGTSTLFYINGSLSSTQASSTITANDAPLTFGNDGVGSRLDGRLDDVALYSKALSSTEVSNIYGGVYPTSNLMGLWTFEGDTGTTITDKSGNGNNGTLSSSSMLDTTGQRT